MKEETRRAVAFAAAARITGRARGSIYSYTAGRHTNMSGDSNSF